MIAISLHCSIEINLREDQMSCDATILIKLKRIKLTEGYETQLLFK
jgi:hypothetical protein